MDDLRAAIAQLRAAVRDDPGNVALLADLAVGLAQCGELGEARALLESAHAQRPGEAAIAHNLAEVCRNMGDFARAEPLLQALVAAHPPYLPSVSSYIALLEQRFNPDPGGRAILARLHAMQGSAWRDRFQYGPAEQAFRRALAHAPDDPHCTVHFADLLRAMGRPSEAVRLCREVLARDADHAAAWNGLGCALVDLGRMAESERCFERALGLDPHAAHVRHNAGSGAMLNRLYRHGVSASELHAMHRDWGRRAYPTLPPRPPRTYDGTRRCRVGFLSGDFRYHAMAHFIEPLLAHLDRGRFEIVCYDVKRGDDPIAERLRGLPLTWRDAGDMNEVQLEGVMRADGLDLLVDLMGHTLGTRLNVLARRPAPVMAVWLGYPFTTGFPGFDYRIADPWTDPPDSQPLNTERLAVLPRTQFCYRPSCELPATPALPADGGEGTITFGSRNAVCKLNPAVIRTWAAILSAVPGSRLLLQAGGLDDLGAAGRLYGLFEANGIGPERLAFEGFDPRPDNLLHYQRIDIALDTFPFNGGATTCDALWMGVPVITLAGEASFARMGASILTALGHAEWIATTPDAYVRGAAALALDRPRLRELRSTLRARMKASPLCDEAGFAQAFGDLLCALARAGGGHEPLRRTRGRP